MAYVESNQTKIYYEASGNGPTLLFTHGFACSGRLWESQLRALSDQFRMIAWDVAGHDRSDSPGDPSAYSREAAVADMVSILDACGAPSAVLVGHSLGCVLSTAFYVAHPQRVDGLFLIGGGAGPAGDRAQLDAWNANVAKVAEDLRRDGLKPNPGELGQLTAGGILAAPEVRLAHHRSAEGLARAVLGLLTFNDTRVVDALPTFDTPTRLCVGENEALFMASADRLTALIPGASKVVIPDAGHTPNLEQPERFNAELVKAVAEMLT